VEASRGLVTVETRERLALCKYEILRLLDGVMTEPPTAEYAAVAVDDDGLPRAPCGWCGGRVFGFDGRRISLGAVGTASLCAVGRMVMHGAPCRRRNAGH
jgi:hypothetical protein